MGNYFQCYFKQLFISLALRKCKKDCKIASKIILVQGFCPLKTSPDNNFLSSFASIDKLWFFMEAIFVFEAFVLYCFLATISMFLFAFCFFFAFSFMLFKKEISEKSKVLRTQKFEI